MRADRQTDIHADRNTLQPSWGEVDMSLFIKDSEAVNLLCMLVLTDISTYPDGCVSSHLHHLSREPFDSLPLPPPLPKENP